MAKSSSTGTIIGLAVAGAAAYWAYSSGLFSSLLGSISPPAASTTPALPVASTTTAPSSTAPAPSTPTPGTAQWTALPLPAQVSILQLNPTLAQQTVTPSQVAAAEAGNGIAGLLARQLKAQGVPQAQIDAQVLQILQNAPSGVSGLGRVARRVAVRLPGKTIVLGRNYRWRAA